MEPGAITSVRGREGRSNSASATTSPFQTSPESPRPLSVSSSASTSSSPSHLHIPPIEIFHSSPLSHSSTNESGSNSAPSSPTSIRRSAGSRKSLNLSSLASSLHRSPTTKNVSPSTASTSVILSVQVPALARKKKINFTNTDLVKDALQVIKEKFELGDEMESYELFIPQRGKYCKRNRTLSSYKLKDNDEVLLKEKKGSSLLRGSRDKENETSYVVRVALPIAFTRSGKPSSLFRHLPTSASASPASSLASSPATGSSLSISSYGSVSPANSPLGSPYGSPTISRRRSLSNSSSSLSLMNVGKNLSSSRSSFNLARKAHNRNSVGLSNEKEESPVGPGMFVDEFQCDVGHTAYDIIKKVEDRYPLVDRDVLDDFSLYKDGVWLDRRKTFDWYKITPNDVLVFKPLWIRLELELEGRINTIKVLPNFTIRVVKNYIKRFSMKRTLSSSTPSTPSSSNPPSSPKPSRVSSSPTLSSLSPSLRSLSINPPPPLDLKATWDFTSVAPTPFKKVILEVEGEDGEENEAVEGFTLAETREYFAKYEEYELFLMPTTQPQDTTIMGMLLEDDNEVSYYRLQRHMRLSFRQNDEFTKRHFRQVPQSPEPGRLVRTSSPSFSLSAIAALSGYLDDRIYVVVNSMEHRICKLFDFDKDALIRHIIESFLHTLQACTGIKENPDRYSLFLNTNELMGGDSSSSSSSSPSSSLSTTPVVNSSSNSNLDDSSLVLLDATKNLSLYPLKDMDSLELRRNTSVFAIDPSEFDKTEDNGCSVPFFLATIRNELYRLNGWQKEGIFRVAGSDGTMNSLSRQFFHNIFTSCDDTYSLASFIKRWYLRLPSKLLEPLSLDDIEDICTEPAHSICDFINSKLKNRTYRELFRWLIALGADVAAHQEYNKMNAKNIAIVFGPVLYETEVLHTHQKIIMIVQTLIEDYSLSGPPPRVNSFSNINNSNSFNNNNNGNSNNSNNSNGNNSFIEEGLKRKPSKSRIFGGN